MDDFDSAQSTSLDAFKNALRNIIGEDVANTLDAGSDHPFSCTCKKCWEWWRLMGPDEDGNYGPFGKELPEVYQGE